MDIFYVAHLEVKMITKMLFMQNGPQSHSIHLQEQPAYLDLSSLPHWRPEQHIAYPERIEGWGSYEQNWALQNQPNFQTNNDLNKRYSGSFWILQKKVFDKVTPKHLTLCPNQT